MVEDVATVVLQRFGVSGEAEAAVGLCSRSYAEGATVSAGCGYRPPDTLIKLPVTYDDWSLAK